MDNLTLEFKELDHKPMIDHIQRWYDLVHKAQKQRKKKRQPVMIVDGVETPYTMTVPGIGPIPPEMLPKTIQLNFQYHEPPNENHRNV